MCPTARSAKTRRHSTAAGLPVLDVNTEAIPGLTDCTISLDSAGVSGGGLGNRGSGKLSLAGCTISGDSTGGHGGGLDSGGGDFYLFYSTISGNSAEYGGGLENDEFGYLTNCTISANSAQSGGGIYNFGTAKLADCTIGGNSVAQSGGGLDNAGTATLTDTIVAANTGPGGTDSEIALAPAAPGTPSPLVSGSYNLIVGNGAGGFTNGVEHNIVLGSHSSPGLDPLGSYGGPTQTMALQLNSPAIGMGNPLNDVTTDQRGMPLDPDSPGSPDIGAFQAQPGLVVNTTIDGTDAALGRT